MAAGAVLKHSRDFNLTREAVIGSALSPETPAYDLQQACATGLETVVGLANKIKLGQMDSAIAGGVDSASDAPIAVSEGLRAVLLELHRAQNGVICDPHDFQQRRARTHKPRIHGSRSLILSVLIKTFQHRMFIQLRKSWVG